MGSTASPPPPGPRLAIEREADDRASGWAHDPSGSAELTITLGGEPLLDWPRTIARGDVNAVVGAPGATLGFEVPVGAIATLLALTAADQRPDAALRFGPHTHPIAPAAPVAVTTARTLHDAWLSDRNHLRLRLADGAGPAVIAQAGGPISRFAAAERETIVTAPLSQPFHPVLIALITETGPDLMVIPFPSLLRGGLHEAEGFAIAGGDPVRLAAYAVDLAASLIARPKQRRIAPAAPAGIGIEPGEDPAFRAFLAQHAVIVDAADHTALPVSGTDIPTLAALAGGGRGLIALTPPPGGAAWLVERISTPALDAISPAASHPAPHLEPDTGRPLLLSHRPPRDEADLETLLFPLAPGERGMAPHGDPGAPIIVLSPEATLADALLPEGLPAGATVHDARDPLPADLIAGGSDPVLFLNRAVALHDPRTVSALANIVALDGVATAGCLIVRETQLGDTAPSDRIVAAGLTAAHSAPDQPWRPPLAPLEPWPMLARTHFLAAANHPSCVMVDPAVLRAHGAGLTRFDAADLLELMRRASAAGLAHAVTTWFSVFDRRAHPPPLPAMAPVPRLPDRRVTRLMRLS